MYGKHPCFTPLNDNDKIWRYVDFAKFSDLLRRRALYFNPLNRFNDKWEGAHPVNAYSVSQMEKLYKKSSKIASPRQLAELTVKVNKRAYRMRNTFAVNCWHVNDDESEALWKIYGIGGRGVAIQSTFGRLRRALDLEKSVNIYIGKVRYINYETDSMPDNNIFWPSLYKRSSFKHENELRAVIWSLERPKNIPGFKPCDLSDGKYCSVDVAELIEGVHVDPMAHDWLVDLVKSTIKKYGHKMPCIRSNLFDSPNIE